MNADCRRCEDVNAFLTGDLSPREEEEFSNHLENCPACRAAANSSRRVLAQLRAVPDPEPAQDLVPLILARIHAPAETPRRIAWHRIAAVAALFVVFTAVILVREALQREPSSRLTAAEPAPVIVSNSRALDWFVRTQEADGSWSAERWGGQRNYAPALTALPLLALLSADETNTAHMKAAVRAAANLLEQQNPDGTFGPAFQGSPYNTSIATLALLHTWERNSNAVPRDALDTAVAALSKRQTVDGGWGYPYSPLADRSITQWHIQALELAANLGWTDARPALDRGLVWLNHHATPLADSDEPADSTSALLARATARPARADSSLDFYQAYFSSAALKHEAAPTAQQHLATLRQEILRHQATEGTESGSWPPDDRWGRAGGRLYSTALASMSLASR
jgi:hypothetical protein